MTFRPSPSAKPLTYEQALQRLAALCGQSEHSSAEVRRKARLWQLSESDTERLVDYLTDERYIDDARYCRAFVRDKLRYNHWGRIKIYQMLRMQNLDEADIRQGMDAIDEEEYRNILTNIIRTKARTLHEEDSRQRQAKILRHAASKGFELDTILKVWDSLDEDT